jgi:hypothetical protein
MDGKQLNTKHGLWDWSNRYNVDQVPMNFSNQSNMTMATRGSKRVWCAGAKGCNEKRMATLQICVRMANPTTVRGVTQHPQMKQTIVFKGKGKGIKKVEWEAYDPRVIVKFNKKAYYDSELCNEWALTDFMDQLSPNDLKAAKVVFCDNLGAQTTEAFIQALAESNTALHLLPAGE